MNNAYYKIRATGDYATYNGREYFSYRVRDNIRLFSDEDPAPKGFVASKRNWVRSENFVPLSEIQHLAAVQTICIWRGHRFEVGVILSDIANVTYLGTEFDDVGHLPGMTRPDKYEVVGKVPVSELTDVEEHVVEVPIGDKSDNEAQRRD